ncbi:Sphingomyelin phosphodiesterase [Actinidia chinensis var. chinensis]|uniref:Sphingomyelin phosphodiesterase n=1 Tax=Actinidia chinensis var. chinensis TaxID=1590841 RepID=A0A2R6PII5_ACTCC|nr:Sphingomyelin phosphodiesterase [Actinidia chinensis var. chinensis]
MISHTYAMDTQTKSADLASTILAAASPPQIAAACDAIETFFHQHGPDQALWFFSVTFPTLICKIFGFDDSSPPPPPRPPTPQSPNGWIDAVSNDSELAARVFNLLSPNSVLMSSISAVDRLSLVKYVFPIERLPEWVRFMLQNKRDCRVLADLCPLFKGKIKEDSIKGSSFQIQLNVFEYYVFWFAYYPLCKGNSEYSNMARVQRSKKFRLENWASSFPGFSNSKRVSDQKVERSVYIRLLYAYLREFVPISDLSARQPYRSSLLHYSMGYDTSVIERAEFIVNNLVHFWLVDNDFSPLPVNVCKSFAVSFPFRSAMGETPPSSGLGEVVNMFVKYLNLSSVALTEVSDQVEYSESPRWRVSGYADAVKSRTAMSVSPGLHSVGCWNSWIQRPLYRFILRTFLFCPMETSIKNASQVFSVWISYMEPWTISLEDFKELEADGGAPVRSTTKVITPSPAPGYSSSWQSFVLSNYLFYSSLVIHFVGFAHKFLHKDPKAIVQMVSKVISILTSSRELIDLIKNVDIVFHSKPMRSSKSMLSSLYRFIPTIREQLQDWEDGLCESDADGSFLHENWNKDLRLFSDGEDGGQQLLQLFVLRAEFELQAISGDNLAGNLQCLDSLKSGVCCLFGGPIDKPVSTTPEGRQHQESRIEIFKPRRVGNGTPPDIKYKGDWMKRPISNDEVAWLAKLLVRLSGWLNQSLGLNQGENGRVGPAWSYVEVSGDASYVSGPSKTMKVLLCSVGTWFITSCGAVVRFMKKHGLRVNLRILASKKVVTVLLVIAALNAVRKAIAEAQTV